MAPSSVRCWGCDDVTSPRSPLPSSAAIHAYRYTCGAASSNGTTSRMYAIWSTIGLPAAPSSHENSVSHTGSLKVFYTCWRYAMVTGAEQE